MEVRRLQIIGMEVNTLKTRMLVVRTLLVLMAIIVGVANACADDSWLKASWSDKADLPYQKIDKEVEAAYEKAAKGDKQEFYSLARKARVAFDKDNNSAEKLYRAVMYERYLLKVGKKLTKADDVDFERDAQHFNRLICPNSYRYCRLAYIMCIHFDRFRQYEPYYEKLLKRDGNDIDVIRVAAKAVFGAQTTKPVESSKKTIQYLLSIDRLGKAIVTDYKLLSVAYDGLYDFTKDIKYLQESLKYQKRALEVCPDNYERKDDLIRLLKKRQKRLDEAQAR